MQLSIKILSQYLMLCSGQQHTFSPPPVNLIIHFLITVFWLQNINELKTEAHAGFRTLPAQKLVSLKSMFFLNTCSSLPLLLARSIQVRRVGTYLMIVSLQDKINFVVYSIYTMVKMLIVWWQSIRGIPKPNLQLRMPLEDWPDHKKPLMCDQRRALSMKLKDYDAAMNIYVPSKPHPSKVASTSLWNFIFKLAHSALEVC